MRSSASRNRAATRSSPRDGETAAGRAVIIALALTSALVAGDPHLTVAATPVAPPPDRATAAALPAPLADALAARAAERGLAVDDAFAPVVEAAQAGVPSRMVAEKILEGLAKGVPPPRVLGVARDLGARLVQSRDLLETARAAGLAPAAARDVALADLAGALGQGVPPEAVRALVTSARGGHSDAVVAAARMLGELARRGVPVAKALPLARAVAARGPASNVAALYDEYRREGGADDAAFLAEAERRVQAGVPLDGLVDRFGEGTGGVVRNDGAGRAAPLGVTHGPGAAAGEVPGLDGGGRGRGHRPKKPK